MMGNLPCLGLIIMWRHAVCRQSEVPKRVDSGDIEGRQKEKIKCDGQLGSNQEATKSSCNRAARL